MQKDELKKMTKEQREFLLESCDFMSLKELVAVTGIRPGIVDRFLFDNGKRAKWQHYKRIYEEAQLAGLSCKEKRKNFAPVKDPRKRKTPYQELQEQEVKMPLKRPPAVYDNIVRPYGYLDLSHVYRGNQHANN